MKTISNSLLLYLLLFCGHAFAQESVEPTELKTSKNITSNKRLQQGSYTFSFDGSGSNNKHQLSWSLTPQAGYLVIDRLAVGLQLSLANRFSKQEYSWNSLKKGSFRENSFMPEIYARYDVLPFRVSPFLQISSGYNFNKINSNDIYSGEKYTLHSNSFVLFGALGLRARLGENLGFQVMYRLPMVTESKNNKDLIRMNRFRIGLSLDIGKRN
jgi:hypothetical protein|tara:strand:- start:307 stop:945 length:639 start_codon:yes stop_codon:yes gene_type:complete